MRVDSLLGLQTDVIDHRCRLVRELNRSGDKT